MGRMSCSSPLRRSVNTMNTPRPLSVRPMARKRRSRCEWAASGRMDSGREKRLSITEVESPWFSHLERLPLSQSKPLACSVMVAEKIGNCIGKRQGLRMGQILPFVRPKKSAAKENPAFCFQRQSLRPVPDVQDFDNFFRATVHNDVRRADEFAG